MTDSAGRDNWLQEQLQQWQEIAQQLPLQPEQWQAFLDSFQTGSSTDFADQQASLLNLMTHQSEQFSQFAASLLNNPSTNHDQLVDQLQDYMQQQYNDLLSRQWNLPEPFTSLTKDAFLNSEALAHAPLRELLEQLAKAPEIDNGPYSPSQVRLLAQAAIDFQDALHDYLQQYEHIFKQTAADLKQLLDQPNTDIDSVNVLQNLWIECYEKAYRDTVFTDQYQTCHGRISNSLMRMRQLAFNCRDNKLKELGLVTREELDSTIRQQHKLRKQLRRQQQEIEELRALVLSLKSEHAKPNAISQGKT
ncbi:poly(R)-hydroxyalkanoic acid synthase subunit PhaE [Amphritea sp. 1_MG-2023]|uniref:poly(R)-hydroxyalkanoic acid synthase subunit PhaE n=1 Tax=Amphritea sp. 1_MG-2023 TaxID=3062670 RepID=UPI0026E164B6|nr:poly(R)-hydroxyalkanoic acid synthase subunit PhaE [Amphritea sp. 1_MG-2023]MDO6564198.1 poly(R)-hydroxyalkanoic acid synthase subunit PhaE [Amphritea sp. 1_MG-2023]